MCDHPSIQGDNYGQTCMVCGEVLEGWGFWAEGSEACKHSPYWEDIGNGLEMCPYCEETRPIIQPFEGGELQTTEDAKWKGGEKMPHPIDDIVEKAKIMIITRQPEDEVDNPDRSLYHLIISIEDEEYAIDIMPSMSVGGKNREVKHDISKSEEESSHLEGD